jgi:2-C-methyl-D-erythritol 4-phosphate cytidylyltransferase
MSVGVVVVAGGRGRRFGPRAARPKQFLPAAGRPLLYWPLRVFERLAAVRDVVLVVPAGFEPWARDFVRRSGLRKVRAVATGGKERADSVRSGWRALAGRHDVVLVHDAARVLVTADVVRRVIAAARRSGAALAGWPVPDTLKRLRRSSAKRQGRRFVGRTVPRDGVWLAQTPQGFKGTLAARVLGRSGGRVSDDVQFAEKLGIRVEMVPGSASNFKVTVPEDFRIATDLLRERRGE